MASICDEVGVLGGVDGLEGLLGNVIGPEKYVVEGEASKPNVVADDDAVEPVVEVSARALLQRDRCRTAGPRSHAHDSSIL